MKKKLLVSEVLILTLLILSLPAFGGCGANDIATTPTVTTGPGISSATPSPTKVQSPVATVAPSNPGAAIAKYLRIGGVTSSSGGVSMSQEIMLLRDMINAKGGLTIGGEKYQIQLYDYDGKHNEDTETSVVNRVIFQDKVKFILTNGDYIGSWIQEAETNEVVTIADSRSSANLASKWQYSCTTAGDYVQIPISVVWFARTYPELAKNWLVALPNTEAGHAMEKVLSVPAQMKGAKMSFMYYAANDVNLYPVARLINDKKPAAFTAFGAGDAANHSLFSAVWQAGYRGQYFNISPSSYNSLAKTISAESLEGLLSAASVCEFDTPLTTEGQEFKEAYKTKYNKWDDPDLSPAACFYCLASALQKAGTMEADDVAEVIQSGLTFTGADGEYLMIARPDLGNERTVDAVTSMYFKTIKDSQPELLETISPDQVYEIWQQILEVDKTYNPLIEE